MFRARTVFVLGAGASCEVGLPDGATLLEQITHLLRYRFDGYSPLQGDNLILHLLRRRFDGRQDAHNLVNSHLEAAAKIVQSAQQALSIDNVIDMLEDAEAATVGKLAISRAILAAEAHSTPFRVPQGDISFDLKLFRDTWYNRLTKLLTEGIRVSGIERTFDNLQFINFNYDRCLEHYLAISLDEYFGCGVKKAQELVDRVPVHRPYGRVGRLPWQKGDAPAVAFGNSDGENVASAASQLRTFTEQIETDALDMMREAIAGAQRIVFLGFAFHRQNLQILDVQRDEPVQALATAYKVSPADQDVITTEMSRALCTDDGAQRRTISLLDGTCVQLFDQYWRTLTAQADP